MALYYTSTFTSATTYFSTGINNMNARIPHIISARAVTFVANGKTHSMTSDNPNFAEAVALIRGADLGTSVDLNYLIGLTSPKALILTVGGDRLKVQEDKLFLDGTELPKAWYLALLKDPNLARVLLINVGDTVQVAGDEDAPDGQYIVQGVDNADPENRIYLETDEGFLGFIKSSSIKESRDASP